MWMYGLVLMAVLLVSSPESLLAVNNVDVWTGIDGSAPHVESPDSLLAVHNVDVWTGIDGSAPRVESPNS